MRRCLALAARGAGHVSPNPLVGAVLVGAGGEVLGEGWHRRYGGPHAEAEAVREAEERGHAGRLPEATLYVNLEPCSHWGKTPPCADLVLEKRIPRVVVAHEDPFPAVAGRGLARLREAGVGVTVGVLEREARRLNEAFLTHVATGRPLVTLKWAQTLDGQVATASGDSRWVSSEESRRLVHRWRAEADAVLVGAGTAQADDPRLTVRLAEGRQPLRVVLDRAGTLSPSLNLFSDAHAGRTVAVVGERATPVYTEALEAGGGRALRMRGGGEHLDLGAVLDSLGAGEGLPEGTRAVQALLVEAGPGLATALLEKDLVDRLFVFVAPKLAGRGTPAVGDLGVARMAEARRFAEAAWDGLGPDVLFRGYLRGV